MEEVEVTVTAMVEADRIHLIHNLWCNQWCNLWCNLWCSLWCNLHQYQFLIIYNLNNLGKKNLSIICVQLEKKMMSATQIESGIAHLRKYVTVPLLVNYFAKLMKHVLNSIWMNQWLDVLKKSIVTSEATLLLTLELSKTFYLLVQPLIGWLN